MNNNHSSTIINIQNVNKIHFFTPTYRLSGAWGKICCWIEYPQEYCESLSSCSKIARVILIIPKIVFTLFGNGTSWILHRLLAERIDDYDEQFDKYISKCRINQLQSQQDYKNNLAKFFHICITQRIPPKRFSENQEILILTDVANALPFIGNESDGYYQQYLVKKFNQFKDYKCVWLFMHQEKFDLNDSHLIGKKDLNDNHCKSMVFIHLPLRENFLKPNYMNYIKEQMSKF